MDPTRKHSFQSSSFSAGREDKPYPLSPTAFPGPSGPSLATPRLGGTAGAILEPMFPDARLEQFKKTSTQGRHSADDSFSSRNSREGIQSQYPNQLLVSQEPRFEERSKYHTSRYEDDISMRPFEREYISDRRKDSFMERRRDQSLEKRTTRPSERRYLSPERREHAFEIDEYRSYGRKPPPDKWDEASQASFGQDGYQAPRQSETGARVRQQDLEHRSRVTEDSNWQEGSNTTKPGFGRPGRYEYGNQRPLHSYVNEDVPTDERAPRAGYRNEEHHLLHTPDVESYVPTTRTFDLRKDDVNRYGYAISPRHPVPPRISPRSDFREPIRYNEPVRALDRFAEKTDIDFMSRRSPLHLREESRMEGRDRSHGQVPFGDIRRSDYRPVSPRNTYGRSVSRLHPTGRTDSEERYLTQRVDNIESSHGMRSKLKDTRISEEQLSDRLYGPREITIESDRRSVSSSLSGDYDISSRLDERGRRDDDLLSDTSSLQPHHRVQNSEEPSFSEESEGDYNGRRGRDKRLAGSARSNRPRSRSAGKKKLTQTHFIIEVQEEARLEDRGVTFSPSTDVPVSTSNVPQAVTETSISSEDRIYAKRLADAALMKQQSEARHQILREVRQAMEMRDLSSEVEDRLFWERQIAALNASLKSLCSSLHVSPSALSTGLVGSGDPIHEASKSVNGAHSGWNSSPPLSTPSPSTPTQQSNFTTVKVQAPESLPAGHQFTVRLNGRMLKATVPSGGVRKGDIFSIRIPYDTSSPTTPVHSQPPATVKVRAPASLPEGYRFTAKMGERTIVATVPEGGVQKGQIFAVPFVEDLRY